MNNTPRSQPNETSSQRKSLIRVYLFGGLSLAFWLFVGHLSFLPQWGEWSEGFRLGSLLGINFTSGLLGARSRPRFLAWRAKRKKRKE